jgi:putative ABC transport system ATP-binding protein
MTTLLEAADLQLNFGQTRALSGASLTVGSGEVIALVGPSGSGKSSLLHCLAGLLLPTAGDVRFRGRSLSALSDAQRSHLRREQFGFVFQFGTLVPELTARENVALPLRLLGWRRRPAETAADDWMARLGVAGIAGQRPGRMSGGQGQRVAIARALITRPAVVFADEPTGALDTGNGALVAQTLVREARERGASVVLVTHDPAVAAHADRQLTVRDGHVLPPGHHA